MSRRHNSSRRRSYGRRQHEVRERRSEYAPERDWQAPSRAADWGVTEIDDGGPTSRTVDYDAADGYGGAAL